MKQSTHSICMYVETHLYFFNSFSFLSKSSLTLFLSSSAMSFLDSKALRSASILAWISAIFSLDSFFLPAAKTWDHHHQVTTAEPPQDKVCPNYPFLTEIWLTRTSVLKTWFIQLAEKTEIKS